MDGKNKLPNLPGIHYLISFQIYTNLFQICFEVLNFGSSLTEENKNFDYLSEVVIQQIFTCSKPIMETPEQFVKHVQS